MKLAPSEDDASQLIGAIHTGTQRRSWSPNRQAAFFQAQLEAGKTPLELIAQYPTVEVGKFILRSRFLEKFRMITYVDLDLKSYVSSRKFPVSVLERLYPNNDFLRILGLSVNGDYVVESSLPEEAFGALAEKVVGDIKSRKIDTRSLNKTSGAKYQEYLTELRAFLNEDGASGAAGSSTAQGSGPPGGAGGGSNPSPPSPGSGARGSGHPVPPPASSGASGGKLPVAELLVLRLSRVRNPRGLQVLILQPCRFLQAFQTRSVSS
ncbi:hypothetical protein [Amycolatopsis sp. WQ 127309]|uniref:hypothetical protein n=1 Tax=Amycolatopsis sp. WQ 127309 TaxID=2932773 RepID=UPI001FF5F080|nr:hypothetical protein [Amycolatopsis sp. WQ 127309]UOZ07904.1 hypothetical protein MUY22_06360 [Amycolatopsis sp. WQ 127309]